MLNLYVTDKKCEKRTILGTFKMCVVAKTRRFCNAESVLNNVPPQVFFVINNLKALPFSTENFEKCLELRFFALKYYDYARPRFFARAGAKRKMDIEAAETVSNFLLKFGYDRRRPRKKT